MAWCGWTRAVYCTEGNTASRAMEAPISTRFRSFRRSATRATISMSVSPVSLILDRRFCGRYLGHAVLRGFQPLSVSSCLDSNAQHHHGAVALLGISAERREDFLLPLRAESLPQERSVLRGPHHRPHALHRRVLLRGASATPGVGRGNHDAGSHSSLPLHGHRVLYRAELHRGSRRIGLGVQEPRGVGTGRA